MRGQLLRLLTEADYTEDQLRILLKADERFALALDGLIADGMVQKNGAGIYLTK
jgi:hypothetical protein